MLMTYAPGRICCAGTKSNNYPNAAESYPILMYILSYSYVYIIVFVAVSIVVTVPSPFVTFTFDPSEVTEIA